MASRRSLVRQLEMSIARCLEEEAHEVLSLIPHRREVAQRRAEASERGRRQSGAASPQCEGGAEVKAMQAHGCDEVEHDTVRRGQATWWSGWGGNRWG
jgi:hypothetical protein